MGVLFLSLHSSCPSVQIFEATKFLPTPDNWSWNLDAPNQCGCEINPLAKFKIQLLLWVPLILGIVEDFLMHLLWLSQAFTLKLFQRSHFNSCISLTFTIGLEHEWHIISTLIMHWLNFIGHNSDIWCKSVLMSICSTSKVFINYGKLTRW